MTNKKESSFPSNGTNPMKENIDSLTSSFKNTNIISEEEYKYCQEVVCFVRRKSPTVAVARKTYSINSGEESHIDNN